jgi:hypothetical protein
MRWIVLAAGILFSPVAHGAAVQEKVTYAEGAQESRVLVCARMSDGGLACVDFRTFMERLKQQQQESLHPSTEI